MPASLRGAALLHPTGTGPATEGPELPWRAGGGRIPLPSLRLRTVIDPREPWPRTGADLIAQGGAALFGERVVEAVTAEVRAFVAEALDEPPGPALDRLAEDVTAAEAPNRLVAAHGLAGARLAAGQSGDAVLLLGSLLAWRSGVFDGLLGLAAVAMSLGRARAARGLAAEAIRTGVRHPSAYCIAGLAALGDGDRRGAKAMLAAAARAARGDPRFREDFAAAQRTLLLMQLL